MVMLIMVKKNLKQCFYFIFLVFCFFPLFTTFLFDLRLVFILLVHLKPVLPIPASISVCFIPTVTDIMPDTNFKAFEPYED